MALPALQLAGLGLSLAGKAASLISGQDQASQKAATAPKDPRLWRQATDFETMFLENMMGHMVEGLEGEGPLGTQGTGADVYRSMLTKEHARSLGASGGVGIADNVYAELLKLQEKTHGV
jgi:peptidoglycan hydrolase FlgJ